MCVGLPGRVVRVIDAAKHLFRIEVAGARHDMSAALIADEDLQPGDWVEIHMGHAYAKLTEAQAREMLDFMDELDRAHRRLVEDLQAEVDPGQPPGEASEEERP